MKKHFYLPVFMMLTLAACNNNKYVVTGQVEDTYDGETVYLMDQVNREFVTLDSAVISKGQFTFQGSQESPVYRYVTYSDGENDPVFADFFLENGKIKINLMHDPSQITVTGTAANDAYYKFKGEMAEINKKMAEVYAAFRDASLSDEEKELKMAEMNNIEAEMINAIKANISNNAASALGVHLLNNYYYYIDYEELEVLISKLSPNLQEDEGIVKMKEQVATAKKTAVGQKFTDLEMLTPAGDPIKLSDYAGKGKVVLVDFWAAWCGPCRREMPRLVDAYAKYKDKGFEIVGVSFDRDGEAWKNGIEQLGITWPQMSDLKYWESEGSKVYAIRSIPHVMLLDKDGIIVSRGLHGDELQAKIAELME